MFFENGKLIDYPKTEETRIGDCYFGMSIFLENENDEEIKRYFKINKIER